MYRFLNQEFLKLLKKLQIIKIPHDGEILQIDGGFFGIFQKLAVWYGMFLFIWFIFSFLGLSSSSPTWGMFYLFIAFFVFNAIYIGFKGNQLLAKYYLLKGYKFEDENSQNVKFAKKKWNIKDKGLENESKQ